MKNKILVVVSIVIFVVSNLFFVNPIKDNISDGDLKLDNMIAISSAQGESSTKLNCALTSTMICKTIGGPNGTVYVWIGWPV